MAKAKPPAKTGNGNGKAKTTSAKVSGPTLLEQAAAPLYVMPDKPTERDMMFSRERMMAQAVKAVPLAVCERGAAVAGAWCADFVKAFNKGMGETEAPPEPTPPDTGNEPTDLEPTGGVADPTAEG